MAELHPNAPSRANTGAPTSGVIHVRTRLTADFTVIANALAQRRGSAVTVGVAAYILSLPDGAIVSIAALCAHFTEGEILISRALRELEAAGYLERRRERGPDGQVRTRTFFYDVPRGQGQPAPPPTRPNRRSVQPRESAEVPTPPPSGTGTAPHPPLFGCRRPPSRRHPRLPPDRRPQTGPVPPRGRRTGPARSRVARARSPAGGDHRPAHRRTPPTLPLPPGTPPRTPTRRDPPPGAATSPVHTTARPPARPALADLRRLRTRLPGRGTIRLPRLPESGVMILRRSASRVCEHAKPGISGRRVMVDRFNDGLLTPTETA
jgi:hypothetical protein